MAGCDVPVGETCGFNKSKNFLNGQITNCLRRSRTIEVITFTTDVRIKISTFHKVIIRRL